MIHRITCPKILFPRDIVLTFCNSFFKLLKKNKKGGGRERGKAEESEGKDIGRGGSWGI